MKEINKFKIRISSFCFFSIKFLKSVHSYLTKSFIHFYVHQFLNRKYKEKNYYKNESFLSINFL